MSESKDSASLESILDEIRREREQKANALDNSRLQSLSDAADGKTESPAPQPETKPIDTNFSVLSDTDIEKILQVDSPEEKKPERTFDGSIDDLLSAYLTPDELQKEDKKADTTDALLSEYLPESEKQKQAEATPEVHGDGIHVFSGQQKFSEKSITPDLPQEQQIQQEDYKLIQQRREKIDTLRSFTEGMEDDTLEDMEKREQKRGILRAGIYEHIKPKDGENLFDAVDEVELGKKKRKLPRFELANNPAKTAEQIARQQKKEQAVLNQKELKQHLQLDYKKYSMTSLLSGCLCGVLLIFSVLPYLYTQNGFLETILGGSGRIYIGCYLALTVLAVPIGYDAIKQGFRSIFRLAPDANTCVLISLSFSILHNAVLLIKGDFIGNGGILFGCAAVFSLFLNELTKLFSNMRMAGNLSTLARCNNLRSIQPIENKADANQLAYGLSIDGHPGILYSTETQLPERFSRLSGGRKQQEKFYTYAVPATVLLGIVIGVISAVMGKSAMRFISSYTACLCICLPVFMTLITNYLIMRTDALINKSGGAILGFETTEDFQNANAVIMDSKDIIFGEVNNFHTLKSYPDLNQQDAVMYCGAILTKGNGVIADVFEDIVKQLHINLPAVEELHYEDCLGFTAWVNDKRVLVGNRDMMNQHNVSLPAVPEQDSSGLNGKVTLYMALDGTAAAAFQVTYHIGKNAVKQIKRLTQNGVVLMLLTNDPGVTEAFVAKRSDISIDCIKIANSKSREIMRIYRGTGPRKKDSALIYKPSNGALLKLINANYRLIDADTQASYIQIVGILFAAGICLAVSILGTMHFLSSVSIIVYQLIFAIIACLVAGRTLTNY